MITRIMQRLVAERCFGNVAVSVENASVGLGLVEGSPSGLDVSLADMNEIVADGYGRLPVTYLDCRFASPGSYREGVARVTVGDGSWAPGEGVTWPAVNAAFVVATVAFPGEAAAEVLLWWSSIDLIELEHPDTLAPKDGVLELAMVVERGHLTQ